MRRYKLVFAVVIVHYGNEVEDLVGVTDFIVVPGNNFDERIRKGDTGFSIENGCERAAEEVGRNNVFFRIAEDAFQFAFGSFFA